MYWYKEDAQDAEDPCRCVNVIHGADNLLYLVAAILLRTSAPFSRCTHLLGIKFFLSAGGMSLMWTSVKTWFLFMPSISLLMPAFGFVSSHPSLLCMMGSFRILCTLPCSCRSSLEAVVIVSPVFVVTVMLFTLRRVGDGSSVPGRSLVVSVDVLACLLVLPFVSVSSCGLFSGAGSG